MLTNGRMTVIATRAYSDTAKSSPAMSRVAESLRGVRITATVLGALVAWYLLLNFWKTPLTSLPAWELLWASIREVFNTFQAAKRGCHIVTVPHEILAKVLKLAGMDLADLSLDTVCMFHQNAVAAGYHLRFIQFSSVGQCRGPRSPCPKVARRGRSHPDQ